MTRRAKGAKRDQLSAGEQAFAVLYAVLGNATEACARAFPRISKRERATEYAKELLGRPLVQYAIEEQKKRNANAEGTEITVTAVRARIWAAFQAAPIEGGDIARLGKLLLEGLPNGLLPRKVELGGKDGTPISIVVNGIIRDPEKK